MPRPLTARQREVLDVIEEHVRAHGYPPSLREIARHFGWRHHANAEQHVAAIAKKGWLAVAYNRSRGLRLTTQPGRWPRELVTASGVRLAAQPIRGPG